MYGDLNGSLWVDVLAPCGHQQSKQSPQLHQEHQAVAVVGLVRRLQGRGLELEHHGTKLRDMEQRLGGV